MYVISELIWIKHDVFIFVYMFWVQKLFKYVFFFTTQFTGAQGLPTYKGDCSNTGKATLTGDPITVKNIKKSQKITASIQLVVSLSSYNIRKNHPKFNIACGSLAWIWWIKFTSCITNLNLCLFVCLFVFLSVFSYVTLSSSCSSCCHHHLLLDLAYWVKFR